MLQPGRALSLRTAQDGGSFQAARPMHHLSHNSVQRRGSMLSLKGLAHFEAASGGDCNEATKTKTALSEH